MLHAVMLLVGFLVGDLIMLSLLSHLRLELLEVKTMSAVWSVRQRAIFSAHLRLAM